MSWLNHRPTDVLRATSLEEHLRIVHDALKKLRRSTDACYDAEPSSGRAVAAYYALRASSKDLIRKLDSFNSRFGEGGEGAGSRRVQFIESNGKRYHHRHSQWYNDCQLITAVNAAIFLGLPTLSPHLDELGYKGMAEYAKTVPPDCGIDERRIARIHRFLRMKSVDVPMSFARIKRELRCGRPVELSLQFHEDSDVSHSTLVIETRDDTVRCTNLTRTSDGWIEWEVVKADARKYAKRYTGGMVMGRVFSAVNKLHRNAYR